MKILFTGFHFDSYSGSQMHICEMASYLASSGHSVSIASPRVGKEIKQLLSSKNISLYTLEKLPVEEEYDVLFLYHFVLFAPLWKRGIKCKKIVNGALSSFKFLEKPIDVVDAVCFPCVSYEVLELLKQTTTISKEKFFYLPNFIPLEYANATYTPKNKLKKVAIVSNHIQPELAELKNVLQGIDVDIYGIAYKHIQVTPELLQKYDVVISIGKTVQYAMGMGMPVYEYDLFGGCGYVTLENIDSEEFYNFSGRATRRNLTTEEIAKELVGGYADALRDAQKLKEVALEKFLISKNIDALMECIENSKNSKVDAPHLIMDFAEEVLAQKKQLSKQSDKMIITDKEIKELTKKLEKLKKKNKQYRRTTKIITSLFVFATLLMLYLWRF